MTNSWQGLLAAASLAAAMVLGGCSAQELTAGDGEAVVEPGEDIGKTFARLTAQQIDNAANKGINWTVTDTVAWAQSNNSCTACHRAPAPLFGASISAYTGYNVNMSTANGAGYLADFIANSQYAAGFWAHDPANVASMRYVNSAYASFGLAGYTQFVNSRYLSKLQKAIEWIIPNTLTSSVTFPADGRALQGVKAIYVPQDRGAGAEVLAWNEYIPTAQYAIATRAALDMGGLPSDKVSLYQNFLHQTADYLEGKYVRAAAGTLQSEDIAYMIIGALADGRTAGNNTSVASMRDALLNSTVSGAWGDNRGYGSPNPYSTGMALYALCRLGVRSDQNATVSGALDWLVNNQCSATNNYCGTGDATRNGSWYIAPTVSGGTTTPHPADVPTTFAVLALGCYGSLNAQVTLSPSSVMLAASLPSTQTTSFNVTVRNTGYVTNTYTLVPSGTLNGMRITHNNPSMTLDPNGSATDTVTLVLPANLAPSQIIPVSVNVAYLTPSGPANKTVTFNVYIPPQPNASAERTYIASLGPASNSTYAPGSVVPFSATVRKVADNSLVTQGTLTFYSGGAAIATVTAASGTFAFNWTVPTNAIMGPQTFTASYNGYATVDYSVNIGPSSLNGTYTIGYGSGSVCASDVQCQSGFCVDGVCCNTACGGGDPTDCQACSRFAGGTTDGTCGAAKAGVVCRGSRGLCDAQETCDGTSTTCPTDAVANTNNSCGTNGAVCNPSGACAAPGRGLYGSYYNTSTPPTSPSTPAAYTVVQNLGTDWGTGSPATGVNADNFSTRWTGEVITPNDTTNPTRYDGLYKFTLQSDEGVRLWVDGRLLIDNWSAHASQINDAFIYLKGGGKRYSVKIEYYELTGNATALLQWTPPGALTAIVPTTNLNPAISNPLPVRIKSPTDRGTYSSTANVVVDVEAVGMYSPVTSVTLYVNGAAQATLTPAAGQTTFTWSLPSLSPGLYTLTARATGNGWDGVNQVLIPLTQWATPAVIQVKAASGDGSGLTGDYFNGSATNTFAFTRSDYTVSLVADGNPNNTLLRDITDLNNYSVRWTGKVNPIYSQAYTFSVQTNQQARVWVNNTLLVDTQNTQFSGTIGLTAGVPADIKVEYYKSNGANSLMKLYWESPSEPRGLIPGVRLYPNTASTR